ncbi:MAG: carboxylesterase family protein, partial [Synergistaceae bacterium]|nr:carboxylesterase family protein [Synergistaceae bacterium]
VEIMGITLPEQKSSRRVAELTLKNLNVDVTKLKEIPYSKLREAADNAMAQTIKEGEKIYSWSPVKDGDYIPADPVEGGFPEQAKDIPLLIGTALNEWVTVPLFSKMTETQSDNKNFWTNAQIGEKLREKYGDKADAIAKEFTKAYPHKKAVDALYVDTRLRSRAIKTMNIKAEQNGAAVYAYIFTWETPVMGGYAMAYHCSELPFVFNNIALSEMATGGGEKAQALADKMSQAWINFARTGNPNHEGLPEWPAYTRDGGATMIFDNESSVSYKHDDELMKLLLLD